MIIPHLPRASRVEMDDLVRLLLISALAWALVGCSTASQQTHRRFEYAGRGLYRTHHEQSTQVHSKRRVLHGRTISAKKTNAPHRKHNHLNKITSFAPTRLGAFIAGTAIQWFSHGIFVLRPHFLRHWAAQLLHVPRNGQIG